MTDTKTSLLEQAQRIHQHARNSARDINDDRNLTLQGRHSALNELRETSNAMLAEIRAKRYALDASELEKHRRQTLSHPAAADVITKRDAAMRAAQLADEDEATTLLKTARRLGDESLIVEILSTALDRGWASALRTHADSRPHTSEALTALLLEANPRSVPIDQLAKQAFSAEAFAFNDVTV